MENNNDPPVPAPYAVSVQVPVLARAARPLHDQMTRSIEVPKEPTTLSAEELQALREGALHIINAHGPEEAARIFIMEGYKPPMVTPPRGSSSAKICRKRARGFR